MMNYIERYDDILCESGVPSVKDHAGIIESIEIFMEIQDPLISVSIKSSGDLSVKYKLNGFKYELAGNVAGGKPNITSIHKTGDGDNFDFNVDGELLKSLLGVKGLYNKFTDKIMKITSTTHKKTTSDEM